MTNHVGFEDLLTAKQHEKGAEMQVISKEGKALDMYITLMGQDSRAWRNAVAKSQRDALTLSIKEKGKKGKKNDIDTTDIECETLASVTLGWRGFIDNDGKELKFSKAKIKQLYVFAPYIRDQVDVFVARYGNFIKG